MKTKNLIILLIVAAVVCVAAITLHRSKHSYTAPARSDGDGLVRGAALLPAVSERIDDIDRVEYTKDGETFVLVRDENRDWQIESVGGYPADEKQIKKLIFELTSLRVGDRVTDNPERHERFGLEGEEGELGRLVLHDRLGKEVATLILGGGREAPSSADGSSPARFDTGRYVRIGDAPSVYLVEQEMSWLSNRISQWIESEIANVDSSSIAFTMVEHATTETLHVSWEGGPVKLVKPELPEGMRLKSYEVSSLRSALTNVSINGVLPLDQATSITFPTVYRAQSYTGVYYHVAVGEHEGKRYIRISGEYTVALPTEDDMATTETEAAAKDRARDAERSLPAFNERHAPWVYEVSDWVAGKFDKTSAGVLEPAPTPTPASASDDEAAEGDPFDAAFGNLPGNLTFEDFTLENPAMQEPPDVSIPEADEPNSSSANEP